MMRSFEGIRDVMVDQAARTIFVDTWARQWEEQGNAFSSGARIDDLAPPTPLAAFVDAGRMIGAIEEASGVNIWALYGRSCVADGGPEACEGPLWEDGERQRLFAHYVAMEALGHGVSWFDDHQEFDMTFPTAFEATYTENAVGGSCPNPDFSRDMAMRKNADPSYDGGPEIG